ncbi:MAG TPA: type II toxin-antitoxin system RelE/ParE family toxin [Casimicrobiaceae bacterium]|nr:type II toxin-antitoxin system RelE/ParE family toxin [Casimicrobiaceae bacterium]
MKAKRVIRHERANVDIDDAIDHYLDGDGPQVAERFIDALEAAFQQISRFPGTGSPRYGVELGIADLRAWPIQRYPFLMFYVERSDAVEILRVSHTRRDIPPLLR